MPRQLLALEQYLEYLRKLPFVKTAKFLRGKSSKGAEPLRDALLSVRTPGGMKTLPCEIARSHLSQEMARHLIHVAREVPDLLILAPVVGRKLGDLFEKEQVNFIDLAGNCHISLDGDYVARVQGRSRRGPRASDKELRAASYRVLFAMLVEPELVNAATRVVAKAAGGVSPQTVNNLRVRLQQQGRLVRGPGGYRWASGQRKQAVDIWLAGFGSTLFPRLLLGRFRPQETDLQAVEARLAPLLDPLGSWCWGGGAAAIQLTRYYRGDQTLVYFLDQPPSDIGRRLRLVRDENGPLLLAQAPGPLALRGPSPRTAHPLLVYADLLAESNYRAQEAARVLREKFLRDLEHDE